MNRSVSLGESSTSAGLLLSGVLILGVSLLVLLLSTVDVRPRDEHTWLIVLSWLGGLVGAAILLVGLIAKGVAVGIGEADRNR